MEVSLEISLEVSLEISLEISLEVSLEISLEVSLEISPPCRFTHWTGRWWAVRRSGHGRKTEDRLAHAGSETATLCFVTSHCMKWQFGGLFIRIV